MACLTIRGYYIGGVGRASRPYSVAWISQWLAEPRTRVRIAVGPLNVTSSRRPLTFVHCTQITVGPPIEYLGLTYSSSFTSCTFSFRAALADAFRIGRAARATQIAMHTPQRYDISSVTVVTS